MWELLCQVCSDLGGHVCGDYDLEVRQFSSGDSDGVGEPTAVSRVCRVGEVHSGRFVPGDSLLVRLRAAAEAGKVRFRCFLWATEDGELPPKADKTGEDGGDDDALKELVTKTTLYRKVGTRDKSGKSLPATPLFLLIRVRHVLVL